MHLAVGLQLGEQQFQHAEMMGATTDEDVKLFLVVFQESVPSGWSAPSSAIGSGKLRVSGYRVLLAASKSDRWLPVSNKTAMLHLAVDRRANRRIGKLFLQKPGCVVNIIGQARLDFVVPTAVAINMQL